MVSVNHPFEKYPATADFTSLPRQAVAFSAFRFAVFLVL